MPMLITLSQRADSPARQVLLPGAVLTALYDRSRDSRKADMPGQDFIAFTAAEGRIAFCVCDGVSQSFYGDLAARYLGENLCAWLAELPTPPDSAAFAAALDSALAAWLPEAVALVTHHPVNPNLPGMLRAALEKKRAIGSETMFVAGLIDQIGGQLYACWMGDMRLRLWDAADQPIEIPGAVWETRERWSMLYGPRNGSPRTALIPLDGLARLTAHSDGVGSMTHVLSAISTDGLDNMARELAGMPASDDISVLDIALHPTAGIDGPLEAHLAEIAATFAEPVPVQPVPEGAPAPITFRQAEPQPQKAPSPDRVVPPPTPARPIIRPTLSAAKREALLNTLVALIAVLMAFVWLMQLPLPATDPALRDTFFGVLGTFIGMIFSVIALATIFRKS